MEYVKWHTYQSLKHKVHKKNITFIKHYLFYIRLTTGSIHFYYTPAEIMAIYSNIKLSYLPTGR